MGTVIALLFSAIESTISLIAKYRKAAQQSGEWTAQDETNYKTRRDALMSQPHWQIDP